MREHTKKEIERPRTDEIAQRVRRQRGQIMQMMNINYSICIYVTSTLLSALTI